MSNRKLIRPSLAELKDQVPARSGPRRRLIATDQTNAENFYYVKQMQNKTPVVLVLRDGEVLRGTIDWYDKHSIRLGRHGDPSLLVLKHNIKYIYKENEDKEREAEPVA